MKDLTKLDFALSDLQTDNKTLRGLLASLSDEFEYICSPIGNKQLLTDEQKTMVAYELLRDKDSINALLRSLKHFTNEQGKKLDDTYDEFITNSEVGTDENKH